MSSRQVDVVIVGASFAGLHVSRLLTGQGLTVPGLEAGYQGFTLR